MSYQVKVPGTKFVLELAQVENDWYLQVKIGDNVEEEVEMMRFTTSYLYEKIEFVLRELGFPLNPLQLKLISDDLTLQAAHLFSDAPVPPSKQVDSSEDWSAPPSKVASTVGKAHGKSMDHLVKMEIQDLVHYFAKLKETLQQLEESIGRMESLFLK